MKIILPLALIILLFQTSSRAAIALVANTCAGSANSGASVTTSGINTTGASLLVVAVAYDSNLISTPTDSLGNTWTALTPQVALLGNPGSMELFYVSNPTTGTSQTFTENYGSTNYPSICVEAFSGTAASSPFDVQNGNSSGGATSLSTGSVTPNFNNELVVTGLTIATAGSISINGSFTLPASGGQFDSSAYYNEGVAMAYLVQTTAAAENPTWSDNGSGYEMAAAIATFEAAPLPTVVGATINNAVIRQATIQ